MRTNHGCLPPLRAPKEGIALRVLYNESMISRSTSNKLTFALAAFGCVIAGVLLFEHFSPATDIGCKEVGGDCSAAGDSIYGHVGPIPTAAFGLAMYLCLAGLCILRNRRLSANDIIPGTPEPLSEAASLELSEFAPATVGTLDEQLAEGTADLDAAPADADRGIRFGRAGLPDPMPDSVTPAVHGLDRAIWGLTLAAFIISWPLQYVSLFKLQVFCPWCFASACTVSLAFFLATLDFVVEGRRLNGEQKLLISVCSVIVVLLGIVYLPGIISGLPASSTGPVNTGMDKSVLIVPYMPRKGDPKAPYLIVEFADYQCPHCQKAVKELDDLLVKYKGKISLAFRNDPLVHHEHARDAAMAALAAGRQGKFWQMHDLIFDKQSDMESPSFMVINFEDYARTLHLDISRFERDAQDKTLASELDQDISAAHSQGVTQTPTFYFISPKQIWRYTSFSELTKRLDNLHDSIWQ